MLGALPMSQSSLSILSQNLLDRIVRCYLQVPAQCPAHLVPERHVERSPINLDGYRLTPNPLGRATCHDGTVASGETEGKTVNAC